MLVPEAGIDGRDHVIVPVGVELVGADLRDHADLRAKRFEGELADVFAVDAHLASLRVIKTEDETDER